MKNVLILICSLGLGGAEKQVVSLFNRIDRNKFNVFIAYLDNDHTLLNQIDGDLRDKVFCLYRKKRIDPDIFKRLRKFVIKEEIHTIICINEYTMFYGYFVNKFLEKKVSVIIALHTTILNTFYSKLKYIFYKRIMNRCDNVLFMCNNQMKYWIEKYAIKKQLATFIYNGVDYTWFYDNYSVPVKNELKKRYAIVKEDTVVCICAALRPEKKHEDLLFAIKKLTHQGKKIKLLVIGDGPRRKVLENYCLKNDISKYVVFAGSQSDVRPFLSICDIFAITSHYVETFSMAILEAMAMSKAVVATNIGGASEMISDGYNGYLYKPGDTHTLIQKLESLMDNKLAVVFGERGREIVENKLGIDKMVKNYEKLLSI